MSSYFELIISDCSVASIIGLCFMSVCLIKSNCYILFILWGQQIHSQNLFIHPEECIYLKLAHLWYGANGGRIPSMEVALILLYWYKNVPSLLRSTPIQISDSSGGVRCSSEIIRWKSSTWESLNHFLTQFFFVKYNEETYVH